MVAARGVGLGWFWRREERTFGFQQGAEGTKPRGRGFDPHRRRWANDEDESQMDLDGCDNPFGNWMLEATAR